MEGNNVEVLSNMFPSYDAETLEMILQAQDGNVELAIDALIAMDSDNVAPTARSTAAAVANRVVLADDFLRVPGSEQERQDAIFAAMLQDEMFQQEMMRNGDSDILQFMNESGMQPVQRNASPRRSTLANSDAIISTMGKQMSSMSETMKKKVTDMYAAFQTRRGAAFSSTGGGYSTVPLVNGNADAVDDQDDGDETEIYSTTGRGKQRHFNGIDFDAVSAEELRDTTFSNDKKFL